MPYEWTPSPEPHQDQWQLQLWPYRSLLRKDFVWFFGATLCLVAMPLLALTGSSALWVILAFVAAVLSGLWAAIQVSYRRGEVLETCRATSQMVILVREAPNSAVKTWEANRYWASVHLHPTGGPVENYLTLRGGDHEVEIGAFLEARERLALYDELRQALSLK